METAAVAFWQHPPTSLFTKSRLRRFRRGSAARQPARRAARRRREATRTVGLGAAPTVRALHGMAKQAEATRAPLDGSHRPSEVAGSVLRRGAADASRGVGRLLGSRSGRRQAHSTVLWNLLGLRRNSDPSLRCESRPVCLDPFAVRPLRARSIAFSMAVPVRRWSGLQHERLLQT